MTTIELSTTIKFSKKITYYITKAKKEPCDKLEAIEDVDTANKLLRSALKNDKAILVAVGDMMKLRSSRVTNLFEVLKKGDRANHYRCYDINREQQLKQLHLVNLCSDTKTCFQSALRAIGYREATGLNTPAYYEAYAVIWKTIENV